MKQFYLYLIIFFGANILHAQQLPIFTNSDGTQVFVNPSHLSDNYTKYGNPLNVNALYRYQWVGVEDAPRTALGSVEYFNEDNNVLLGATLSHDQTGPTGFDGLYGRFAYQVQFTRQLSLMMGLSAGVVQYRVKGNALNFLETGDIAANNEVNYLPDLGAGVTAYFRPSNRQMYYLGLSVPQTLGLNLQYRNEANRFNIKRVRHYHAIAGAQFNIYGENWLIPSVWFKYVPNAPLHFDINLQYEYQEKFWVGFGGSYPGAAHVETGLIVNPGRGYNYLRLGYAFNHYFGSYGPAFGSAHELKVSYAWDY